MQWRLKKNANLPLYNQIVILVEEAIQNGQLLSGEKLPPERRLAKYLGVNRSTVVRALDELAADGKISRIRGSGTYINKKKQGLFAHEKTNWRHYVNKHAFNFGNPYTRAIIELSKSQSDHVIDLATGELPIDLIPEIETPALSWQSFLAEEACNQSLGYLPLRQAIQKQMKKNVNLEVVPEQLLITSGAQQALFLITQCLLAPGDAIAIETPSYFYSLSLFQSAGLRIFALPLRNAELDTEELERLYRKHRIKMIFVNPTFQNPTGIVMSATCRKKLVDICAKLQLPIVEDDPFGQLAYYAEKDITPLKNLDKENVLYIGSLSKVMGSTTQIGWIDGPAAVVNHLAEARQEMDIGLSIFPQVLASYVLNAASFTNHLLFLQKELKRRRNLLIAALESYLPHQLKYDVPNGGFHLWIELPGGTKSAHDFNFFLEKKLLIMPGFIFGVKEYKMRVTFAQMTEEKATFAAHILANKLQKEGNL